MSSVPRKSKTSSLFAPRNRIFQVLETKKRETELECSCGGKLLEFRHVYLPKPPRKHRKKRINKKWQKKWEKENRFLFLASSMLRLMLRPRYRCVKCKKEEGFYSAIGRNMFKVEPLPS